MKKRMTGIFLALVFVISSSNAAWARENDSPDADLAEIEGVSDLTVEKFGLELEEPFDIMENKGIKVKTIEQLSIQEGLESEINSINEDEDISVEVILEEEIDITEDLTDLQKSAAEEEAEPQKPVTEQTEEIEKVDMEPASLCDIVVDELVRAAGEPDPFIALKDSKVKVVIANIGTVATGNFTSALKIDGRIMALFTVDSLESYKGVRYTVVLREVPGGTHKVEIVGDYNNLIKESNESNNAASNNFYWQGTPNLKVEFLTAEGKSPYEVGTGVDFTFKVINNGSSAINGKIPVVLKVDGEVLATWVVKDWARNEYLMQVFNLSFERAGVYRVEIEADPNNEIAEISEIDNVKDKLCEALMAPKLRISGRVAPYFRHSHDQSETAVSTPLKGFKVIIMDKDSYFDDRLAVVYTDANGYFDVFVNNQPSEGGVDLYLRLELDDDEIQIRPYSKSAEPYFWQSSVQNNIQAAQYDFGLLPLHSLDFNLEGAFSIWHWIKKGNDYYKANSNNSSSLPKVFVDWEDNQGEGSSCVGDVITISGIKGTVNDKDYEKDCFDGDVILHEYGHFIMAYTGGDVPGAGGEHFYTKPSSLPVAYSEAWAHFFSCAVRNDYEIKDTDLNSWFGADIEQPAAISSSSSSNSLTPLVNNNYEENAKYELNVAAVLWDLFDDHKDGIDQVSHDFSVIDDVMAAQTHKHIYDFYDQWFRTASSSYSRKDLWEIFESRKCSYDQQVPVVSLSVNGFTAEGTASDDIAVTRHEWYVDDIYYSGKTGSNGFFDGRLLPPGNHKLEFRAYDPEGEKVFQIDADGNENRPRKERYGKAKTQIVIKRRTSVLRPPVETKAEILKTNPRNVRECRERLLSLVQPNERIIADKIDLLLAEDAVEQTAVVGREEDLTIYPHIVGVCQDIYLYAPNGKLYRKYNDAMPDAPGPDRPIVVKNAEPGEWKIKITFSAAKEKEPELWADLETPIALIMTAKPTAVMFDFPQLINDRFTNDKAAILDLIERHRQDSAINVYLNGTLVTERIGDLAEGKNRILMERIKDGICSDPRGKTFILDTIAPEIYLGVPQEIVTAKDNVLLQGGFSADVHEVFINGVRQVRSEFGDGFIKSFYLNEGINTFVIKVVDQAGNETETTVTVLRILTTPIVNEKANPSAMLGE